MTAPTDALSLLESLAASVFRARATARRDDPWSQVSWNSDPLLQEAHNATSFTLARHADISSVVERVFAHPDLIGLAHRDSEMDPMVLHAGGGSRQAPPALVAGLLSSAFLQMLYLRLPADEDTFILTVLEGFEELRRAARGERAARRRRRSCVRRRRYSLLRSWIEPVKGGIRPRDHSRSRITRNTCLTVEVGVTCGACR